MARRLCNVLGIQEQREKKKKSTDDDLGAGRMSLLVYVDVACSRAPLVEWRAGGAYKMLRVDLIFIDVYRT